MLHFPIKCRCHASNWEIHPTKITCLSCHFTEHFENHETVVQVLHRMKHQGCYFLDKDKDSLKDAPILQLTGNLYR